MRKSSFWCLKDPHWCEMSAVANVGALAVPGGLSQERVLRAGRGGKGFWGSKSCEDKGEASSLGQGADALEPRPT